ncbi:MAG: hypothetical protein ABFS03_13720 [Chloroflexota bacterium]
MKKEYMPYYISRLILSAIFAVLVMGLNGLNWMVLLLTIIFFGFFILYLHSGWYRIDLKNPYFPLRRDSHGELIQRKALIAAVVTGLVIYLILSQLSEFFAEVPSGSVALPIGILVYFLTQFILFARA